MLIEVIDNEYLADVQKSVSVDMCPTNCKWCSAAAVAQAKDGVSGESVTTAKLEAK